MVLDKKNLTIQGKTIKLKPNLNSKSYGFYVGICLRCDSNCEGKTKNSFSNRLTSHRFNCNRSKSNCNKKDISDENALYRNYCFKNNLQRLNFNDAYEITFMEEPNFKIFEY